MEWRFFRSLFVSHGNGYVGIDVSLYLGRISHHNGIGGDILSDNASGADNRVLPDRYVGKNCRSRTDRSAFLNQRSLHPPILFTLQLAVSRSCAGIGIVDERDAGPDTHVVFYRHAFTNDAVASDLTT